MNTHRPAAVCLVIYFQLVAFASLATINNQNYRLFMLYPSLKGTSLIRKGCENVRQKTTICEAAFIDSAYFCLCVQVMPITQGMVFTPHARYG